MRTLKTFLAVALLALVAFLVTPFGRPETAEAASLTGVRFAGDSVRFVARFNLPATSPALDSVTIRWSLTGNSNQYRKLVAPFAATAQDTALFSAPAVAGGATIAGDLIVTTWRSNQSTPTVKVYTVNLPDLPPLPGISGLVLLDSAVVF